MRGLLKFIAALSVTMLLMLMFRALFFTLYTVPNASLEPQFLRGDRILVNRCSYGLRMGEDTPNGYSRLFRQRIGKGDITAFNFPIDTLENISSNPVYVGFCSAVPGDTVRLNSRYRVIVPGRGINVDVTSENAMLLCNMLRMHEHRESYVCNGILYVDGRETHRLRFEKDYYWMSTYDRSVSEDSRVYGFVPEDHVIGRVVMLVYSRDVNRPFYEGFRKGRFLKLL